MTHHPSYKVPTTRRTCAILTRCSAVRPLGTLALVIRTGLFIVAFLLLTSSVVAHHVGDHGSRSGIADGSVVQTGHTGVPHGHDEAHLAQTTVTCVGLLVLAGLALTLRGAVSHRAMRAGGRPSTAATRSPLLLRTPVSLSVVQVI